MTRETEEGGFLTRDTHPESGSTVIQVTSGLALHGNFYCEVPYMDPTSRYLIYSKHRDARSPFEIWRADLKEKTHTPLFDGPQDFPSVLAGAAVSPDQRYFYCNRITGEDTFEVFRIDIATLERKSTTFQGTPIRTLGSAAPDNRTYVGGVALEGSKRCNAIARMDLEQGTYEIIYRDPWAGNPHPQVEPGKGEDILIQHSQASLILIDKNGENRRDLPVGPPHTPRIQGHECWIGTTGNILLTVGIYEKDKAQELLARGILWSVHPGDDKPKVVAKGASYSHVNASKDGRFFVADAGRIQPEGPVYPGGTIVVGSIKTGKKRLLCQCRNAPGSEHLKQFKHAHPYFSPDRKWVIFDASPDGKSSHVFAASVPDGLLEELEQGGCLR